MQHTDLTGREEAPPLRDEDRSEGAPVPVSWHQVLKKSRREPARQALPADPARGLTILARGAVPAPDPFPMLLSPAMAELMDAADPHDPIARQFVPSTEESTSPPGWVADAVADGPARQAPGLLQKYRGRVLLVVTGACAVHCRYCFRRHYPYGEEPKDWASFEPALAFIRGDSSIREVILSGGDPLTRTDAWLSPMVDRLASIGHLKTLRVHTRMPTVLPERVSAELLAWLTGSRLQPVVVLHVNHPRELSPAARAAIDRLRQARVTLLNQAVLLAGVNDNVETLESLSRELFSAGVLPYYLHQLDRVQGTSHFEVSPSRGEGLIKELRARLPGYLVPQYVREISGEANKVPVFGGE